MYTLAASKNINRISVRLDKFGGGGSPRRPAPTFYYGLGCGWFVVAAAVEPRLAFTLAGVAEGFVEGAVVAERRVGEDARDDPFGLGLEGFVGAVAFGGG